MNNYKKYLDKAKKNSDSSNLSNKEKKDKEMNLFKKYASGGKVKEIPYKDLIAEHKQLVKDLEGPKKQHDEQKKELEEYKKEAKMSDGGKITFPSEKNPDDWSYKVPQGVTASRETKDDIPSKKQSMEFKDSNLNNYDDGTDDVEDSKKEDYSDDRSYNNPKYDPKNQVFREEMHPSELRQYNMPVVQPKDPNRKYKLNQGGQVKESQQKEYQAKDYPGKLSYGSNSFPSAMSNGGPVNLKVSSQSEQPSYYNKGGVLNKYANGTDDVEDDSPLSEFAKSLKEAFSKPPPPPPAEESREDKYTRIRKENSERMQGSRPDFESNGGVIKHYDDGTSKVPDQIDAMAKKYGWDQKTIDTIRSNKALMPPSQDSSQMSPPTPPPSMPSGVDQGINLNPQAAQNVAQAFANGGMVKEHGEMYKKFLNLYGGLPKVPKLENPLAKVHAPAEMKVPLNIPRGAKMHFPKRLKAVGEMTGFDEGTPSVPGTEMAPTPAPVSIGANPIPSPMKMPTANTSASLAPILKNTYSGPRKKKKLKFADGTSDVPVDNSMDLGDVPVDSGPYPGEEAAAQQSADSSTQGQLQQQIDDHNQSQDILKQIDQALGKDTSDEDYPKIQMPTGRKPLLPMSDEGESSDDQHDKEDVSKEDADLVNKLGKEDTDATKASDQTTDAQLAKEDSGEEEPSKEDKQKNEEEVPSEDNEKQDNGPMTKLAAAQEAQRNSTLFNTLGAITDKMGASMGHFAPQNQDIYAQNIKNADLPVKQLEEQIQMQKYDPNSATSKSFRQYLAKFGGQDVEDLGNISAADAAQIAPMAFKQFEAKQAQAAATINKQLTTNENLAKTKLQVEEKYQQSVEHNDLMREIHSSTALQQASNKADKDKALQEKAELAASKDANEKLFGSRQPPDVKQSRLDHINAQKGLDTIDAFGNGPKGLDGIDPQMTGGIRLEVQKIMQSGAPAEGGINHFDPNTWSGKLAEEWGKFSNSSTPANASSFLKEYQKYLHSMQDTTGSLINDYNTSILNIQKRKMNPDDYENTINSPYVSPYTKYSKSVKSTAQQTSPTGKTVVRKGYNPTTNQTQLIYNDGTKQIVDGKQ